MSSDYRPSCEGGPLDFPNAAPLLKVSWGAQPSLICGRGLTVQQGLFCELRTHGAGSQGRATASVLTVPATRLISVPIEAGEYM